MYEPCKVSDIVKLICALKRTNPRQTIEEALDCAYQELHNALYPPKNSTLVISRECIQFVQPQFRLGQAVICSDGNMGAICGLVSHNGSDWQYFVRHEDDPVDQHAYYKEEELTATELSPFPLTDDQRQVLDGFIGHFQKSHGPVFSNEGEAVNGRCS